MATKTHSRDPYEPIAVSSVTNDAAVTLAFFLGLIVIAILVLRRNKPTSTK